MWTVINRHNINVCRIKPAQICIFSHIDRNLSGSIINNVTSINCFYVKRFWQTVRFIILTGWYGIFCGHVWIDGMLNLHECRVFIWSYAAHAYRLSTSLSTSIQLTVGLCLHTVYGYYSNRRQGNLLVVNWYNHRESPAYQHQLFPTYITSDLPIFSIQTLQIYRLQ